MYTYIAASPLVVEAYRLVHNSTEGPRTCYDLLGPVTRAKKRRRPLAVEKGLALGR